MRRPGPWKVISVGLAASLVLALVVGSSTLPATGRPANPKANRFGPSGVVSVDPDGAGAARLRAQASAADAGRGGSVPGPSVSGTGGCNDVDGSNVRVNQECTNQSQAALLGRAQAQNETAIAVNPKNPRQLLAGQNDYRHGDGGCGADWSLDGGRRWGSGLAPHGFTAPGFTGARHYWNAAGDPSVAFDTSGEAYLFCLVFDRAPPTSDTESTASGLVLFRSPNGGASWNFPASPVRLTPGDGSDGIGMLDKPYMAVDTSRTSRFRDRIYVAWAEYNVEFTADPIGFAWSDDHGATWNLVPGISGSSPELCPVNFSGAPAGTCDANQFPQPFTAPNGDLYVAFQNFNNAVSGDDNRAQILVVKSTDGGASFGPPVKVSDFYDLPDCLTYTGHDAGRSCVPTAPTSDRSIFRATNYPSGVASSSQRIVVTLGSYLNRHSNPGRGNCAPAGYNPDTGLPRYDGVGERNGCNNDIVVSVSDDAGASFTGTATPVSELPSVSDERPGRLADQWWQWAATNPRTGRVAVAYYDRKYGDAQTTGEFDITMRRSNGDHVRVTNRTLPPTQEFPEAGATTGTFLGDYMGLAIGSDGIAHPIWTDTRNPIFSPSTGEDVRELVPAGQGTDIYSRALPG